MEPRSKEDFFTCALLPPHGPLLRGEECSKDLRSRRTRFQVQDHSSVINRLVVPPTLWCSPAAPQQGLASRWAKLLPPRRTPLAPRRRCRARTPRFDVGVG